MAAQYAEQQAGGLFLETSRFGDDEDRIIQRANGTPVTSLRTWLIISIRLSVVLRGLLMFLGRTMALRAANQAGVTAAGHDAEAYEFILVQMVRLMRNGEDTFLKERVRSLASMSWWMK